MVMSMTGFARVSQELSWGAATWELKSVNHRYLEMSFRLPEAFRLYEAKWRQLLQQRINRGKVECSLRYLPKNETSLDLKLNTALVQQLARAGDEVRSVFAGGAAQIDVVDVLAWPGVVQVDMGDTDQLIEALSQPLQQAVDQLLEMRQAEGNYLHDFLLERIDEMQVLVDKVDANMPQILQRVRDKLLSRFDELKVEVDQDRFEQEVVWLMQKADVAEELHRLQSHLKEVKVVLEKKGAIGRRLDFLMQELNREANTLASKSIDLGVTNVSVDLKVLIEQMREQVQNIE